MRKIFFTTILLFLALGQAVAATLVQGEKLYADVHDCGTWYNESSTDFRLWYGEGESDYVDVEGSVEAGFLWSCDVERDDISRVQLKRVDPSNHSTVWNWSDIFDVESGKDVLKLGENCDGGCKWKTCTWYATTPIYVTPSTLTYTNSATWDPETKTLKANVKVGDNPDRWMTREMTFTGKTYSGEDIYSCKLYCLYGGVHVVQFQVYNGETQEGLKEYDKEGTFTDCWSNIQNKIYNGTSWLTYGRDITIYAVPEIMNGATWDEESHSLYANFKYGDGDGEWVKVEMDKTAYTYKANPIYSATMFIRYNVIKKVEFLYNDGSDHELYVYVPSPQHVTGDIDDKIFIGAVSDIPTWNESYVRDYDIYYDINGGEWQSGWVGKRSYGEGDQDLSSDVTKLDYNFAGWYDNSEFAGSAYTAVSSTLADNIVLYAKWEPFSKSNFTPALNPIICTAAAGDVVVVAVSATQSDGAYIRLEDKDGVAFGSPVPVSGAGDYAIPLTASDAAKVNAGLIVSGSNYTISDVTIKYQKTLWTGTVSDNKGWTQSGDIGHSIFADLSADDFLGVYISAVNDGAVWHQYALRANYENQFSGTTTVAPTTKTHQLTSSMVTALKDEKVKDITAQYLDVSALYTYIDTINYTVEEHNNGGRIWADSVGNYTFGVGATLPTEVTKWNYNFEGWYDNEELDGDPVTSIGTGEYGHKDYYAKWTSILKEYPVAPHPEFLAVQEGDIIVVNVTSVQTSSKIYLYGLDYSYTEIENRDIASTGKHIFHLNAAAATNIRNYGFFVAGNNFTFDDVEIRYRKTIWTGPLNAEDNWKEEAVGKSIFSGLSEGDFLGFDISKINTGGYHQYAMRADYDNVLAGSCTETGIAIHQLSAADITALTDSDRIDIVAQYLEIAHLYAYSGIFVIYRTGDAPDGGIETFEGGTIDSPIEYRMKVHTLDQWYSLYLPFTVDAIKVIEDGIYYDIQPYYRPEVGGTLYQGHYFIRTPAKTEDFEIANFSDWRDPASYLFTPSGNTPYVIMWHDLYFRGKYIAFFGHKDSAIPTTMTVGDRPTKDSVVNVYGNDAMISGSVVDAYTFEADYGHGSWLREETIGDFRMIPPFESYLRANAATTPIFKVVRKEDTTTGIDPTSYDPSAHANKVLINGQVVIVKDNKMYNILGMEIQ